MGEFCTGTVRVQSGYSHCQKMRTHRFCCVCNPMATHKPTHNTPKRFLHQTNVLSQLKILNLAIYLDKTTQKCIRCRVQSLPKKCAHTVSSYFYYYFCFYFVLDCFCSVLLAFVFLLIFAFILCICNRLTDNLYPQVRFKEEDKRRNAYCLVPLVCCSQSVSQSLCQQANPASQPASR